MKLSALAASLALAAFPALAEFVRVVDGDTLKIDGVTYRLWGIDAPDAGQLCADGWPAGQVAAEHLRALIRNRQVSCEARTSTATAAPSRFAVPMAATSGPTWWPTAMPGPSSDIAASTSRRNAKLRRSGPAYMVAPANPRGVSAPSGDSGRFYIRRSWRGRVLKASNTLAAKPAREYARPQPAPCPRGNS